MEANMARCLRALLLVVPPLAVPLAGASALTVTVSFEKIADTATAIPGGTGAFTSFGRNPSIDGGEVAFRGEGEPPTPVDAIQQGVYSTVGGLGVLADQSTAIPGGVGSFETLTFKPSIDAGALAWSGDGASGQEGIYQDEGGGAEQVAGRNTLLPGGQALERFDLFVSAPVRDGGAVVFHATGDGGGLGAATSGLYTNAGGTLAPLVDTSTLVPGTAETFAFLSDPALDAGEVAFRARGSGGTEGVYRLGSAGLATVADQTTPAPSGALFAEFGGEPALSGGVVVFRARDASGLTGLFRRSSGGAVRVADASTPIPDGGGAAFSGFGNHAIDRGVVVFEGIGAPGSAVGLYAEAGGELVKIIDLGDSLDGKTPAELEISREAISENRVAFWARFGDGSEGVFVATLPEPGAEGLLAAALLLGALSRRRR